MSELQNEESQLVKAIIVDVDGTVALRNGRGPFDWEKLGEDLPNIPILDLVNRIASTGVSIIFVTGREDKYREQTSQWLKRFLDYSFEIYCRVDNDFRKDVLIKYELFKAHIDGQFDVISVFDDRSSVVDMWRNTAGLVCLQVAAGDF